MAIKTGQACPVIRSRRNFDGQKRHRRCVPDPGRRPCNCRLLLAGRDFAIQNRSSVPTQPRSGVTKPMPSFVVYYQRRFASMIAAIDCLDDPLLSIVGIVVLDRRVAAAIVRESAFPQDLVESYGTTQLTPGAAAVRRLENEPV
jgi:hypothetical protein